MLNFKGISTSNKFHWKSLFSSLDQLRRRRVGIQIAVPSCHCRSKKTLRPILQFDDTYYHTISAYLIWVSVSKTGCNLCAEICSDVSVKFKHHLRARYDPFVLKCFGRIVPGNTPVWRKSSGTKLPNFHPTCFSVAKQAGEKKKLLVFFFFLK